MKETFGFLLLWYVLPEYKPSDLHFVWIALISWYFASKGCY